MSLIRAYALPTIALVWLFLFDGVRTLLGALYTIIGG